MTAITRSLNSTRPDAVGPDPRRWWALVLLATAEFMVILDASIVNIALPSIARGLHFSKDNLAWVVNAYILAFGGLLLLGGRIADLLGRRRVFSAAWSCSPPRRSPEGSRTAKPS
jgi:MFS family permease